MPEELPALPPIPSWISVVRERTTEIIKLLAAVAERADQFGWIEQIVSVRPTARELAGRDEPSPLEGVRAIVKDLVDQTSQLQELLKNPRGGYSVDHQWSKELQGIASSTRGVARRLEFRPSEASDFTRLAVELANVLRRIANLPDVAGTEAGPALIAGTTADESPLAVIAAAKLQTLARLSASELAGKHDVSTTALEKRLSRWRLNHDDGYIEVQGNRRRTDPKFLYDEAAVLPVIQSLKSSDKRRTEKNPR